MPRWAGWLLALLAFAALGGVLYLLFAPPRVEFAPAAVDLGNVPVGEEPAPASVTLTNGGRRVLEIESLLVAGEMAAEFSVSRDDCSGARLPAGRSCELDLTFAAAAAGPRSASLEVRSNASEEPATLELRALATAPHIRFEPAGLEFGRISVGRSSSAVAVTVINDGSAPLEISRLALDGRGERSFTWVANGCSGTNLQPATDCTLRLAFEPRTAGELRAALQVTSNAAESPGFEVRGIGVAPGLFLDPESLDFGPQRVGVAAASRRVRLENTGNAVLEVAGLALSGTGGASFSVAEDGCSGKSLEAGATCDAAVGFAPAGEGEQTATLSVRAASLSGRHQVALRGRGTAPRLELSTPAIDFGQVVAGAESRRAVTLESAGAEPLRIQGTRLEGEGAGGFAVSSNDCGSNLPAGGECRLEVRFAPASAGTYEAALVVEHDGLGAARVQLQGSAVPPPVAALAVSPQVIEFESVEVGRRSDILSLRVSSTGNANLELRSLQVAGEHPEDFQMVPASCNGIPYLVPGSECVVGFRFVPKAAGERRALVRLRHNATGGQTTVPLVGVGAAPATP